MAPMPTSPPLRLFFALWPDTDVREALHAWQAPLLARHGGRPVRPETLHCTLAFLGPVAAAQLPTVQRVAREIRSTRLVLEFDIACYWPHNRIVYAAPTQPPALLHHLATALRHALYTAGLPCDRQHFHPHVTLLRQAHPAETPPLPAVHWQAAEFVLVASANTARGAHYRILSRHPLHD